MADSRSDEISMSEFNTGYRKLRYLTIMDGEKRRTLFYGADLLRKTSVSAANIARKHFNLSSAGYCSRVNLPKRMFRCLSLNSGEGYFYDVKGVMYVAFNFYAFNEQVAMVKNLYHEWSGIDENDVLPQFIKVDMADVLRESFEPVALPDLLDHQCSSSKNSQTTFDDNIKCAKQQNLYHKVIDEKKNNVLESDFLLDGDQSSTNKLQDNTNKTHLLNDVSKVETVNAYSQTDYTPEHNTIGRKGKRKLGNHNDRHQSCHRLLESLSGTLNEFYNHYIDDIFFYKVYNLIEAFLFLLKDELDTVIATTTGIFPFHLLLEFANVKRTYSKVDTDIDNYQSSLLNIFGKWLGMQFCNFRSVISSQVSELKKCLLLNNQFLPSAVNVLNNEKLFPKCMVEFLNFWLNKRLHNEEFQSSKILLVLELLNDELLTGVGHVVYAKLKNTKAM